MTKAGKTQHGEGRQREKEEELDGRSEVHIAAADRAGWRESVEALRATWHEADR